ncbi:MAG: PBPRA1643 family SWIM/SEC-C metal-binding motif protein [Endozoicomonas sp.]
MGKFYTQTNLQIDDKQAWKVFDGKKQARLGSEKKPATLFVQSEARKTELEKEIIENGWFAEINVDEELGEDISALELLRATPKTAVIEKTPGRNDACICGSGKKYKKCCA